MSCGKIGKVFLEELYEGDDKTALGDHPAEQPFNNVRLHRLDGSGGFVSQGIHAGLSPRDVGPTSLPQGSMLASTLAMSALTAANSALVARLAFRRATCSSARVSACFSVKPLSVREAMGVEGDSLSHA